MQKSIVQFLKIALTAFLIIWLVKSGKLDFKSLLILVKSPWLWPAMSAVGLSLVIASERWRMLLRAQKLSMNFFEVFKLCLIGNFFNFAMPGGVGGDLVKGYYITRHHPEAKTASVISVLLDRLIGLYAMILMAILSLVIFGKNALQKWELKVALIGLIALFLVFSMVWVFMLSQKIQNHPTITNILKKLSGSQKFMQVYNACVVYRDHKNIFFSTILLSFFSQVFSILFFILTGFGLGYTQIPIMAYFFVVPIGFMLVALPISVAGIGVGQAAFLFLFQIVLGAQTQIGPDIMTAYQVALFAFGLIGAYYYMALKKDVR